MFDVDSYYEALTIQEALKKLKDDPEFLPIAGGTDLLIKIREGKLKKTKLLGLNNIPELCEIRMNEDESISIGAAASFNSISKNPIILEYLPALSDAVLTVGGPQIRNMGTVGGNLCSGVTSADSAPTLLAYNAKLRICSIENSYDIDLYDFYRGPGKTVLKNNELLVEIRVEKKDYENYVGHYFKYAVRNAMDISTVNCAVVLCCHDKGIIEDVRIAMGVAAPHPIRLWETEKELLNQVPTQAVLNRIISVALSEVSPRTSWRATKEFRIHLIKPLLFRTILEAYNKSGGKLS